MAEAGRKSGSAYDGIFARAERRAPSEVRGSGQTVVVVVHDVHKSMG